MKALQIIPPAVVALVLAGCAHRDAPAPVAYMPDAPLANRGIDGQGADRVRALLAETARRATTDLGRPGGYDRYDDTRVPLPKAAEPTVSMLRAIGYGRLADPLMMDINRGLELAARQSMPALEGVIAGLGIADPLSVLADDHASGTRLLCAQREALVREYAPVLNRSLVEVGYYKTLDLLIANYNKEPVLSDIDGLTLEPELRERGVDGICVRMAVEEVRLRTEPGWTAPATAPAAANITAATATAVQKRPDKATREAIAVVRETLVVAGGRAITTLARPGGYLKNPATRISLPDVLQPAAAALREHGLGRYVDELEIDMNVSAEIAAPRAWPLLQQAVEHMTIDDAPVVVLGDDTAATRLLQREAEGQLLAGFRPAIDDGLRRTGFIDSYRAFLEQYAALPGAQKPAADLEQHVLGGAVAGIFTQMGVMEAGIRHDPAQRSSGRLRRAYASVTPAAAGDQGAISQTSSRPSPP